MDGSFFSNGQMGTIDVEIHGIGEWRNLQERYRIARKATHF